MASLCCLLVEAPSPYFLFYVITQDGFFYSIGGADRLWALCTYVAAIHSMGFDDSHTEIGPLSKSH